MFLEKLRNNEPRTIKPQPKLHSALRRPTARCASHGNRVSDWSRYGLFGLLGSLNRLGFFLIIGFIRVLRFMSNFSVIRAGLREAGARLLVCWVWTSSHVTPGIKSQTQEKESDRITKGMTGIQNVKMGAKCVGARRVEQLVWCGKVILGNANSEYAVKVWLVIESHTGGRNSRNKEESGTNLRKARLSACFWQSLETTSLGQSNPDQSYLLRCGPTARCAFHGNRVSD